MTTDNPDDRRNANDQARRDRLARALRDNLKRRKAQSRGRADVPTEPGSAPDEAPRQSGEKSDS